MRDAFRAGIYPAPAATANSSAPIPTNVTGSPGVTPNNKLSSAPVRARDAAIPSASPRAANPSVRRRMRLCRLAAEATSITLLSTIDIFQRLGVFVGHGMERPTLEEQHRRTDEVYGSAGGDVGSK